MTRQMKHYNFPVRNPDGTFYEEVHLFFSCDCLMASMARSVECFNRKLDSVQVHLIGAVPIVQVKK